MNGDGATGTAVIVGIGDARKRDDAAGLMIARELMERTLPEDVEVVVAGEEGFDLVAAIDSASRAIILAAIQLGEEPGTVHALSPGDAEARANYISSPGEVALIDALELSKMRGGPDVLIVGIEPAEIVPGQTLHPEVQASVGEAAELARDLATGAREWRFFARGDYG
jgi:hydrogenase maturation protease